MMARGSARFRHLHLNVIDESWLRQLTEPGSPKAPNHAVGILCQLPKPPIRGSLSYVPVALRMIASEFAFAHSRRKGGGWEKNN